MDIAVSQVRNLVEIKGYSLEKALIKIAAKWGFPVDALSEAYNKHFPK